MTSERIQQEVERQRYQPLRLHLSSGNTIDLPYPRTLRQNTLVVVHPLAPGTRAIGNYDVVALRLIERVERVERVAEQADV